MRNAPLLLLFLSTLFCGAQAQELAITGAKVYPSPDAQPISDSTILIHAGKISSVGPHIAVPGGTQVLPCHGCVVFAGFWNCHVHFTEAKWLNASAQPAKQLNKQLQQMLTHSGFTTVVDTSSDPGNTIPLRRRIESGEVEGPYIYTAGFGLYPPHAIPFYLKSLDPEMLVRLPEPNSPAEAVAVVQSNIAAGSDIVKLLTGSYVDQNHVVPMPISIAKAAVEAGHQHGQLVFAHPSNLEGVRIAIESGVDVLAHAPGTVDGVDDALPQQMVTQHMAMIPTLKLFSGDSGIARIREIVGRRLPGLCWNRGVCVSGA
jgi:imidazolonepropionase-like amidohydrolase